MIKLASRIRGNVFARYAAVSVCALASDVAVFLMLLNVGFASIAASAMGYSVGILAHWILSSRAVFHDRVSERGTAARTQQKAMFVMSALLGLVVTMAIVGAGTMIETDPRLAKIFAIGISFLLTYMLRNVVIFQSTRNG